MSMHELASKNRIQNSALKSSKMGRIERKNNFSLKCFHPKVYPRLTSLVFQRYNVNCSLQRFLQHTGSSLCFLIIDIPTRKTNVKGMVHLDKCIFQFGANTFSNFGKYIFQFGQIHFDLLVGLYFGAFQRNSITVAPLEPQTNQLWLIGKLARKMPSCTKLESV